MVIFSEKQPSTTIEAILKIEQRIALKLPDAYKKHLLINNGGRCNPNVFSFIENGIPSSSCIDWFLAIDGDEHTDFEQEYKDYKEEEKRMPMHIVPIAYDPGGNVICISCGARDYGKIYYWDHEKEVDYSISDDDNYDNLYLISDDFDAFLDCLTEE